MTQTARPRKRKLFRRLLLTLILLVLVGGAGWYAYRTLRQEYTITYDTYSATTGSISNSLSFSGNLSLIDSATYTASSSGTVKTLYVAEGDEV